MEITRQEDEAMTREIDAHGEHLKASIEANRCAGCGHVAREEINPRNIAFKCDAKAKEPCGWSAIYPIRTLGSSERAERDEALDLIAISEREVIAKARLAVASRNGERILPTVDAFEPLAEAVTLLESREALPDEAKLQQCMEDTEHLEEIRK